MSDKCPKCGSENIHRSRHQPGEQRAMSAFRQPMRCSDCRERFWVRNGAAYLAAGALVGLLAIIGGVIWLVVAQVARDEQAWSVPETPASVAKVPAPAPAVVEKPVHPPVAVPSPVGLPEPKAETKTAEKDEAVGDLANVGDAAVMLSWYRTNAEKGDLNAQYQLGRMHLHGQGALQDFAEAAKWLQTAADRGHPQSQFQLGMIYRAGHGVPQDTVRSYTWLNLAAANGIPEAIAARDHVMRMLTPQQLAQAQKAARDWHPTDKPAIAVNQTPDNAGTAPTSVPSTDAQASAAATVKAALTGGAPENPAKKN